MKKFFTIVLAILVFGLVGCASTSNASALNKNTRYYFAENDAVATKGKSSCGYFNRVSNEEMQFRNLDGFSFTEEFSFMHFTSWKQEKELGFKRCFTLTKVKSEPYIWSNEEVGKWLLNKEVYDCDRYFILTKGEFVIPEGYNLTDENGKMILRKK